jgi:6-phosphogluconate dehydrogenase
MTDSDSGVGDAGLARLDDSAVACLARAVRDGVEHSLLQIASEVFDLTQRVLALSDKQARDLHRSPRIGALDGSLLEASNRLFNAFDEGMGRRQITEKLGSFKSDPANQRLSQLAAELQVPAPTLDAVLRGHDCSARERQTSFLLTFFRHPSGRFGNDPASVLRELRCAYYGAMLITYAQGFALLAEASVRHRFNLDLAEVANSWNAARPERSMLLDDIAAAFEATPSLPNLLCDEGLSEKLMAHQECLRHAVWRASELDIIMPGMLASLDYLDASKDAWLPFNLVPIRPVPVHARWNWGRGAEAEIARL